MNPSQLVQDLRKSFLTGKTKLEAYRIEQLNAFKRMIEENKDGIAKVLKEDLNKPPAAAAAESMSIISDINYFLEHINEWTKPQLPTKQSPVAKPGDFDYFTYEPYGVALVIGAWNFPFIVTLGPAVAAIAAGNCVVIKPSELSTASSEYMAKIIPKYLDPDCVRVYVGGASETTELLKQRFDYIFYTGSNVVGKIIHAAASQYLTPTTLELGGKSPVYLDSSVDIETAAKRILSGKTSNAGQVCIAPDYILCSKDIQGKFVEASKKILEEMFKGDPKNFPNYERIINERHFKRVTNLLQGLNIVVGGESDAAQKYVAPTIAINVTRKDPVMQEEIFGPILPIVTVESVDEAIEFIQEGEKPLALYIFSDNEETVSKILNNTSSGGVCVNDVMRHLQNNELPFGGVGFSGMGCCMGKHSYETFSHKKTILKSRI